MKIITTASYHCTGSSAITDFFSEFSTVKSTGSKEYRLAQELDGLADLEYYLVENNHRFNSSQEIKRFQKLVKRLNGPWYNRNYVKTFGDAFVKSSEEYIDELTELKARSMCSQDKYNHGDVYPIYDMIYNRVMHKIMPPNKLNTQRRFSPIMKSTYGYFSSMSEEEFLKATTKYTNKLFSAVNTDNLPYLMMDQLVPPTNVKRYSRYFSNLFVVIVDRDPRDLFCQEYISKWGTVPTDDIYEFCKWYRITRRHRNKEVFPENAKFIHFEDLIYKYDETAHELMNLVGLTEDEHTMKKQFFNPDISEKNTNMIRRLPELQPFIDIIKQELPEYLYEY